MVEHDVVVALDRDPVHAADDAHVADLHVVVPDDDPAEDDRTGVADEMLATIDDERALVHAGGEVHGRRQVRVPEAARGGERCGDGGGEQRAGAAELTAVLGVRGAPERQQRVAEHLRDDPAECEERHGDGERRGDPERIARRRSRRRARARRAEAAAQPGW